MKMQNFHQQVPHLASDCYLGANDGSRPHDADPGDGLPHSKTVLFYEVRSNQCAGSSEPVLCAETMRQKA